MIQAVALLKDHWDEIALAVCIVGLIALSSVQAIEVASLKADLADAKAETSRLEADAERLARELSLERSKTQAAHARGQQEKENEYAQELKRQLVARAVDRRELDRLRGTIKTYAAGGGAPGGVDAAAGVSDQDRLDRLAELLDEGVELALEGRGVVEKRDAEVKRLLDQIALDRAACTAN